MDSSLGYLIRHRGFVMLKLPKVVSTCRDHVLTILNPPSDCAAYDLTRHWRIALHFYPECVEDLYTRLLISWVSALFCVISVMKRTTSLEILPSI